MAVNGGNKLMQIISWKRRLELASYRSHTCNPAICVRLYFSPGYHPATLIVAQRCSRDFTSILYAEGRVVVVTRATCVRLYFSPGEVTTNRATGGRLYF